MAKDKDKKPRRPRAETPKGFRDYFGAEVRARHGDAGADLRGLSRLGLRSAGDERGRDGGGAGQVPARRRPAERGGLRLAGRGRGVAGAALRPDGAAGAGLRAAPDDACRRRTGATRWGRSGATRSRGRGGSGSSTSAMRTRWGRRSVAADAEMCAMLGEALEAAGIARGDYAIRVNNRKVLNGVMEVAGLLDPADPEAHAGAARDRHAGDRQDRPAGRGGRAGAARGRAAGRERGLHRTGPGSGDDAGRR